MICTVIQNLDLDTILYTLDTSEMAEIRLDRCPLDLQDIEEIFTRDIPLVATCRIADTLQANPSLTPAAAAKICEQRLAAAIEAGAAYVDIEMEAPKEMSKRLRNLAHECGTVFIRSHHDFQRTPSDEELRKILDRCYYHGADIAKIVTTANSPHDAERVLALYTHASSLLAFCMGPHGQQSRLDCLRLGAPYTYAALSPDNTAAPGQWTAAEMKERIYGPYRFVGTPACENASVTLTMPASKSHAQRAIIAAALADGTSRLSGYTPCSDSEAALSVAAALGATITRSTPEEVAPSENEGATPPGNEGATPSGNGNSQVGGAVRADEADGSRKKEASGSWSEGVSEFSQSGGAVRADEADGSRRKEADEAGGADGSRKKEADGSRREEAGGTGGSRAGETIVIKGIAAAPGSVDLKTLHVGESGLLTRLMIPLTAQISASDTTLTGEKTLLGRPLKGADDMMAGFGVALSGDTVPIHIRGQLSCGRAEVSGRHGSQLISGLIMAEALGEKNSTIVVREPKSIPYMYITLDVLQHFGIQATSEMSGGPDFIQSEGDWSLCDEITFKIKGNQHYKPADMNIEADWSAAANFLVAGAIFGNIDILGLDTTSIQADLSIMDILMDAGAVLSQTDGDTGTIRVRRAPLTAIDTDATNCPDLFPILAILAAFCEGQSRIAGVDRLAHKESDRGKAILEMLTQMGVPASIQGSILVIEGKTLTRRLLEGDLLKGGHYTSHHDHRMAMALKVAELGADSPIHIDDQACVAKSFPAFFQTFSLLENARTTW